MFSKMHLFPEAREAMIEEEKKKPREKTNGTTLAEARKKGKLDLILTIERRLPAAALALTVALAPSNTER